jgi:hypothetical protein
VPEGNIDAGAPICTTCIFSSGARDLPSAICHLPSVTWIKTFDPMGAPGPLRDAFLAQARLYPREYATGTEPGVPAEEGITASHSLMPEALYHAFAMLGTAMAPDLPLERRHHEMIATVVSVTNRCRY